MDEWRHKEDRMHSGLRNLFSTQREAGPSIWVILEDLVTAHINPRRSLYKGGAVHTEKHRSNPRQVHTLPSTSLSPKPKFLLRIHGVRDQSTHPSSPPLKTSSTLLKIVTHPLKSVIVSPFHLHISVFMACIILKDNSYLKLITLFVLQWLFRVFVWLSYVLVFVL